MGVLGDLVSNNVLLCACTSWGIAQIIKVLLSWRLDKKLNWRKIFSMGGMPSSHTAFVIALMLSVGFAEGFDSTLFAVSFALFAVVVYDAMGVRYETGRQGRVLNQILRGVLVEGKPITEDTLKELVGHSPLEVLAGTLVGVVCALLFR